MQGLAAGTHMTSFRHAISAVVACAVLAGSAALLGGQGPERQDKDSGKDQESKRPKMSLRGRPNVAISPAEGGLGAELQGGGPGFRGDCCPTGEGGWGD